jgi:ribonuclease HI
VKLVTIHSDGGCEGNPGPGGWAAVLAYGKHTRNISGGEPATTNNRMELQAAVAAFSCLKEVCEVDFFTDPKYLQRGVTKWMPRWKQNNWRAIGKQMVKNRDLWQTLDELTMKHRVRWHWVRGHSGHRYNERCDALAAKEIGKIKRKYSPQQLKELVRAFNHRRAGSAATLQGM